MAGAINVYRKEELLSYLKHNLYGYTWRITIPINWRNHIVSTPEILRGKPLIKATRIPVSLILGYFAAGHTADDIIVEFPDLKTTQIYACLDYARDLADFEEVA